MTEQDSGTILGSGGSGPPSQPLELLAEARSAEAVADRLKQHEAAVSQAPAVVGSGLDDLTDKALGSASQAAVTGHDLTLFPGIPGYKEGPTSDKSQPVALTRVTQAGDQNGSLTVFSSPASQAATISSYSESNRCPVGLTDRDLELVRALVARSEELDLSALLLARRDLTRAELAPLLGPTADLLMRAAATIDRLLALADLQRQSHADALEAVNRALRGGA